MILNLRGPNGSGKSTVARALLAAGEAPIPLAPYVTPRGAERRVLGARVASLDLIVVGPYRTDCGGCDAIKTQELVCESVRLAARQAKHVFFEGVIVSTLFSRYLTLSREHPRAPFLWAYLDTPLDLCLARIQTRNGGKPIKTELVADKVRSIERTRQKALAAGEHTLVVPHRVAAAAVMEMLR